MLGKQPNRVPSSKHRKKSYIQLDEEEEVVVRLERKRWSRRHGLGLTVAGGLGSQPYRDQEPGIFVAKIVPGGAADAAGLKLDDEIVSINSIPCTELDHYQAVDLLRNSQGDIKVKVLRRVPRLVQSALPRPSKLGPLIRSRSSIQLNSSRRDQATDRDPDLQRRRRSSSYRPDDYFDNTPVEPNGYLAPRSPQMQRAASSFISDSQPIIPPPNASALQHVHIDTTGVHFHPYCFACNPSVIHLNQAPMMALPSYQTPTMPALGTPHQHTYSTPTNDSAYPSPVQVRQGVTKVSSSSDESDRDENKSQHIIVNLRRDDDNGLGFIVSSDDRSADNGGVHVSAIVRGGIADRSGHLLVGDRIVSINGISVKRARHNEVVALLSRSKPYVQLEVDRDIPSDVSSSSPSSDAGLEPSVPFPNAHMNGQRVYTNAPSASEPQWHSQQEVMSHVAHSYPMKSSMKSSTSQPRSSVTAQNNYYAPPTPSPPLPPPPSPPPSLPLRSSSVAATAANLRLVESKSNNDLEFPPPPTEIGKFRETITKQTLTEQVVTRETSNLPGRLPVIVEDVIIHKSIGERLGLRIAGGKDSSCIPFGTADEPRGVFISRVLPHGVAERAHRLKIGDRILKINGKPVDDWTHAQVIRTLTQPASQVVITVRHDPPPAGLDEFTIHRKSDEQFGIKISGGLREACSYEAKVYDSGIFVSKVHRGGAIARDGRVKVGMRLLEVNGTNVVGVSRREAIEAFRKAGHVLRLLVCDGWNNSVLLRGNEGSSQPEDVLSNRSSTFSYSSDMDRSVGGSLRVKPVQVDVSKPQGVTFSNMRSPSPGRSKKRFDFKMSDLFESKHFSKNPASDSDSSQHRTTIVMSKNSATRSNDEMFE